jgi:hypothetical protein
MRRVFVVTAVLLLSSSGVARPDRPGADAFSFDVGDDIETYDTDRFRLHFTRDGTHAVPLLDGDADGTPDHVARLGEIYEAALGSYALLGFLPPVGDEGVDNNGGDGRFDVYLVDFGRAADGAYRSERCLGAICSGYMVQENDFAGYGYPSVDVGNRTVASHELFHAVQAAYDTDQGPVFAEATAVWASERHDPSLRDLEGFAAGYLDDAATPLDAGSRGPVDPFSYGAGIFFEYLSERFDDDVTLELWQAVKDDVAPDADWFDEVEGILARRGSSFPDAFTEFSTWTLLTNRRADPSRSFATGSQMALREPVAATLPIDEPSFVVFTASSRLLTAPVRGRSSLRVVLGGTEAARDGARVLLLPLSDDGAGEVFDATDGRDVDVSAAFEVLVLVVNTRQEGSSIRPRLCVGAPDELQACAAAEPVADENDDDAPVPPAGGCSSAPRPTAFVGVVLLVMWRVARMPRRRR